MHCPSKNEQKAVAACFEKIVLFLSIATQTLNWNSISHLCFIILSTALEKELDYALKHKIPVFMVVAVIGSTEESAVDDISKILELKPIYEAKARF